MPNISLRSTDSASTIETISTRNIHSKMSKESDGEIHLQMSPCPILRIDQALGGYSHRERCRAPDELPSQKHLTTQQQRED